MASSCFFLWAVISCTHVLLSSIHRRTEQSWPAGEGEGQSDSIKNGYFLETVINGYHLFDLDLVTRCNSLFHSLFFSEVLTARDEVSAFRVCSQTGNCIQVGNHRVDHFTCKDQFSFTKSTSVLSAHVSDR